MIFAFIDESGHPHPNDSSDRPTLAAVCVDANRLRALSADLFRLNRDSLGKDRYEVKANRLITRGMMRDHPRERGFVEAFFSDLLGAFDMVVFAIVMERPLSEPPKDLNFLPRQFRFILQRVNALAELKSDDGLAAIMFDGNGSQFGNLAERFNNWIFRSESGGALDRLAESPFFVDSKFTPGIQVADMVAGVIRIYHERRLNEGVPEGDEFLSAINRYYEAIRRKSINPPWNATGEELYGIYFMPERFHHA